MVRGGVKFGKYKKIEQTRSNTFDIDYCFSYSCITVLFYRQIDTKLDLRISIFLFFLISGFDFGNQGKAIWYKSNQRFIKWPIFYCFIFIYFCISFGLWAFGTIKQVLAIINPND